MHVNTIPCLLHMLSTFLVGDLYLLFLPRLGVPTHDTNSVDLVYSCWCVEHVLQTHASLLTNLMLSAGMGANDG